MLVGCECVENVRKGRDKTFETTMCMKCVANRMEATHRRCDWSRGNRLRCGCRGYGLRSRLSEEYNTKECLVRRQRDDANKFW